MDTLLIIVTATALAMALAMAGVVVKLLRDERHRSAARVAALTAAAEESEEHVPRATSDVPRADVRRADVLRADVPRADVPRADVPRAAARRAEAPPAHLSVDPREPAWDMLDLASTPHPPSRAVDLRASAGQAVAREHVGHSTSHVAREHVAREHVAREHVAHGTSHVARDGAAGPGLFAREPAASPWAARLAVAAGLAAIVGFGGYAVLTRSNEVAGAPAPLAQSAPLELLSLTHKQQPESLTVTGLVQNPRTGAAISRVVATAFLFGADNTFLGSGRAALDYSTLAPGDESPFVITITVSAPVARYRVGFRDEGGRVIAHVDRRSNGTMAQIAR